MFIFSVTVAYAKVTPVGAAAAARNNKLSASNRYSIACYLPARGPSGGTGPSGGAGPSGSKTILFRLHMKNTPSYRKLV